MVTWYYFAHAKLRYDYVYSTITSLPSMFNFSRYQVLEVNIAINIAINSIMF